MTAPTAWVDGHFIGGNVALDFANTVYRRWPELGADLLNDPRALGGWVIHAGLLGPDADPAGSTSDGALGDARVLRGLLWEVFDAQRDGRSVPAGAFERLVGAAHRGGADIAIAADGSISAHATGGALASVALRAIELLLDPPQRGVRACDRCGWLFIDSSRGRRRRWCSMATCGNQAKAARYRSSHA